MFIDTFDVEMKMRSLRGKEGKQRYDACVYSRKKIYYSYYWKFWKRDVKKDKKFNHIAFSEKNRNEIVWVKFIIFIILN